MEKLKDYILDNKPTVSIGIPAYNEEVNIKNLLTALLGQKQDGFELLEIIVVSDGSSDGTVKEAESVPDEKISVISGSERKGKTESQNEILKIFKGNILVLLDADIMPKNETFLNHLIKPILINPKIGLVGGKVSPLPSDNLFEKILNFSVAMREEIVENKNSGDNFYLCHGRNRAFSRNFAKQLNWPKIYGEDVYSYLMCKEKGFEFHYASEAEVLYRSPQTFRDHMKQSVRFVHSSDILKKFLFGRNYKKRVQYPKKYYFKKVSQIFFQKSIFIRFLFFNLYGDKDIVQDRKQNKRALGGVRVLKIAYEIKSAFPFSPC